MLLRIEQDDMFQLVLLPMARVVNSNSLYVYLYLSLLCWLTATNCETAECSSEPDISVIYNDPCYLTTASPLLLLNNMC